MMALYQADWLFACVCAAAVSHGSGALGPLAMIGLLHQLRRSTGNIPEVAAVLAEHAVGQAVAAAVDAPAAVALDHEAHALHLPDRPAVIGIDLGGDPDRLGKQRREDGLE